MNISLKKQLSFGLIGTCFFIGVIWVVPPANKSELTLPQQSHSNVSLKVQGLTGAADPSDYLKIYVGSKDQCCETRSPMAGRFSTLGQTLEFDPAFDFSEGQAYTIAYYDSQSVRTSAPTLTTFTLTEQGLAIRPRVTAIYPSGDVLPANTLRFYIHFSTPMQPHMSGDFIKLTDKNGRADAAAFMNFKQELWSEDRKRLTLLMDPGRIKQGVAQNLTLGPVLQSEQTYSIVVQAGWQSARDGQTAPRFEKFFETSEALRTLPDTDLWTIKPPRAHTKGPVLIQFDRMYDHQSAKNNVTVQSSDNKIVAGQVSLQDDETVWRFDPEQSWPEQTIKIVVNSRLEDVTGNNLIELLDHSVGVKPKTDKATIVLEFVPVPI